MQGTERAVADLDEKRMQGLENALWDDPKIVVVAVLDGALNPELRGRLGADASVRFDCLMGDYLEPDLAEVAPYAVELRRGSPFTRWVLAGMWGRHWGIVARSVDGFADAARRFRSLFIAYDADHQPMYFRFYDPRALRAVAPACTPEQVAEIFHGLREIWLEGTQPGALAVMSARDGAVQERDAGI
jgi:hypothetical protein